MAALNIKRKGLSLETKMEIIKAVESGRKKADVGREYGIVSSTLSTILKKREDIAMKFETSKFEPARKRFRTAVYDDVEEALLRWFRGTRSKNLPINGPLLQEKAQQMAKLMGHDNFSASTGWLCRFKERHGITFKQVCGESNSVDQVTVSDWIQNSLPRILAGFEPRNIFNADETGLFYRLTPDKTMAFKGEQCHGGKQSKERLTLMLCANMDGSEKLKPLVIGKFQNPRCFKNIRYLPVTYRANRKAWMVSDLFTEWVRQLDRKFTRQRRKVLLFVDNCAAHPQVPQLKAITLQFLPPNTTSQLQPLDQGVIMNMKVHYRRALLKTLLASYDSDVTPQPINVKQAIDMVDTAWKSVKPESIAKCFTKAGFKLHEAEEEEEGTEDPAAAVQTDPESDNTPLDNIWARLAQHIEMPASFQAYAQADAQIECTDEPNEEEIAQDVLAAKDNAGHVEEEEDADESGAPAVPEKSVSEWVTVISQFRDYLQSQSDTRDDVYNQAVGLIQYLSEKQQEKLAQKKITDFF